MVIAIPPIKTPFPSIMPRPLPRPFRIDPSCVFYWDGIDKLSQGKALDESGKNNHGTITEAIYTPDGLFFDGTNDTVDCGNDPSLRITGAISVCVWIKTTENTIVVVNKATNANQGYTLRVGGGFGGGSVLSKAEFLPNIFSAGYASGTSDIDDGIFHFLVGTHDGSSLCQIYVDGLFEDSTPNVSATDNSGNLEMMREGAVFAQGTLAEVSIYTRVLTAAEINNLHLLGKARLGI